VPAIEKRFKPFYITWHSPGSKDCFIEMENNNFALFLAARTLNINMRFAKLSAYPKFLAVAQQKSSQCFNA
jgi:hypothetical protein